MKVNETWSKIITATNKKLFLLELNFGNEAEFILPLKLSLLFQQEEIMTKEKQI